ncbi:MAG: 16S rRNA (cytosine(1402)-N(4))-methyltransferase RsmH [Clostridiales bacterium]|nr:16S rRNA (cytosine(1402)-N(4))-methyltransferase RsmH [Clostridiales bacterium]
MSYHVPVMRDEVLEALRITPGKTYLDATLGGGGHSGAILELGGRVAAIDRDDDAINYCKAHLSGDITYLKGQYEDATALLLSVGISDIAGAVMDLGVSSHQLDDAERGFSYMKDGALDMRMDRSQGLTAYDVVNGYSEADIANILYRYGEESYSRRIASAIVRARQKAPVKSTVELANIISSSVPYRKGGHPAKKSFQAIRIEVNGELKGVESAINGIFGMIERGGRLAVITFHSLEDRIVKTAFAELSTDCICPKSFPVCVCGHKASGKTIGRYRPTEEEQTINPRAKSSTLRVIEKL